MKTVLALMTSLVQLLILKTENTVVKGGRGSSPVLLLTPLLHCGIWSPEAKNRYEGVVRLAALTLAKSGSWGEGGGWPLTDPGVWGSLAGRESLWRAPSCVSVTVSCSLPPVCTRWEGGPWDGGAGGPATPPDAVRHSNTPTQGERRGKEGGGVGY